MGTPKKSKSHLDRLLEEAYYFGLTPKEATELTPNEMASFISARRRHEIDNQKMLARMSYSAGMLGSMSLAKRFPKFEEVFSFPSDKPDNAEDIERSKLEMMAFAANMNRAAQEGEVTDDG